MKPLIATSMFLAIAFLVAGCNRDQTAKPPVDGSTPVTATTPATATTDAAPQLVTWGPQSTPAGTPFQVQADGGSGMFFEFDRELPVAPTAVTFNGKPLGGMVAEGKVVTATVPSESLATPGTFEIVIVMPEGAPTFAPMTFTVEAPAK